MKRKLLVICGPTATGKTSLALYLAKKFDGELISADSRQVYKYMNIGTGKGLPDNAKWQMLNGKWKGKNIGFYEIEGVRVWGYDLVRPDEEFSVKKYADFAHRVIKNIYKRQKLPILVGGTGLYIKAVIDNLQRIHIPRNLSLREKLADKDAKELYAMLMEKSPAFAISLNESDRANPRRLIRAMEVASFENSHDLPKKRVNFDSVLFIGLRSNRGGLAKRIGKRVDERVSFGFEEEVEFLKKKDFLKGAPSVTLGYREWIKYLNGEIGRGEAVEKWKKGEIRYAKRQKTWFKKDKRVRWFYSLGKNFKKDVEKIVNNWYYKGEV